MIFALGVVSLCREKRNVEHNILWIFEYLDYDEKLRIINRILKPMGLVAAPQETSESSEKTENSFDTEPACAIIEAQKTTAAQNAA